MTLKELMRSIYSKATADADATCKTVKRDGTYCTVAEFDDMQKQNIDRFLEMELAVILRTLRKV